PELDHLLAALAHFYEYLDSRLHLHRPWWRTKGASAEVSQRPACIRHLWALAWGRLELSGLGPLPRYRSGDLLQLPHPPGVVRGEPGRPVRAPATGCLGTDHAVCNRRLAVLLLPSAGSVDNAQIPDRSVGPCPSIQPNRV